MKFRDDAVATFAKGSYVALCGVDPNSRINQDRMLSALQSGPDGIDAVCQGIRNSHIRAAVVGKDNPGLDYLVSKISDSGVSLGGEKSGFGTDWRRLFSGSPDRSGNEIKR